MKKHFLKVKTKEGYNIINIDEIKSISSTGNNLNKSEITLKDNTVLYSTETTLTIYDKLYNLQQ